MNKKTIVIDGGSFSDLAGFYEEMNRILTKNLDWKMGQSLDALNDILYGGFGVYAPGESVHIIWKNVGKSKAALGHAETKKNYEMKVAYGHPYNVALFKEKLKSLDAGTEPYIFDIILEIIRDHKNIELTLQEEQS